MIATLRRMSGDRKQPTRAKPSNEIRRAAFLFVLIARQPDLTLDEIVAAMHKRVTGGGSRC